MRRRIAFLKPALRTSSVIISVSLRLQLETSPRYWASCGGQLLSRHDLREHLQRRCAPRYAAPHIRWDFVSHAEEAHVRECARVLVETRGDAMNSEVGELLSRELVREPRV